jgi:arylsulfatase A-like enzyme
VPLLIAGPGLPRGVRDAAPVAPLDLAPTLAAILGIGAPKDCDGTILPNLGLSPAAAR